MLLHNLPELPGVASVASLLNCSPRCPTCQAKMMVVDHPAGLRLKCTSCHRTIDAASVLAVGTLPAALPQILTYVASMATQNGIRVPRAGDVVLVVTHLAPRVRREDYYNQPVPTDASQLRHRTLPAIVLGPAIDEAEAALVGQGGALAVELRLFLPGVELTLLEYISNCGYAPAESNLPRTWHWPS